MARLAGLEPPTRSLEGRRFPFYMLPTPIRTFGDTSWTKLLKKAQF